MAVKHRLIHAGLQVLQATKLHQLVAAVTRGRGAILTLHHVRPSVNDGFAPNRGLEITPAFLDAALAHLVTAGYRFVRMDDLPGLLQSREAGQRFLALTFDDGYRDLCQHALPILEAHRVPFTAYVTTGFLDRTARLWWVELAGLIEARQSLQVPIDGHLRLFDLRSRGNKTQAFQAIARVLLQSDNGRLLAAVLEQSRQARLSGHDVVDRLCLDWSELEKLAAHPLATIGCHTISHPRLAGLDLEEAAEELELSRQTIETKLGLPVHHLCYPYGNPHAAGLREFRLAETFGFRTAVTTRPGVLFAGHRHRFSALPRISINGHWQSTATLDVLLSGAPFAIMNAARRFAGRTSKA